MNTQETNLVAIDALRAVDVFKPGGVESLLAELEIKVRSLNAKIDPATDDGRGEAKSLAYKVTRTKTGLDDLGKEHVADLKKAAGVVDADRRLLRERLDALRDEVRKPVDDWEAAEEARIAAHVAALDALHVLEKFDLIEPSVDDLDRRIAALEPFRTRDWQEFSERADDLIARIGPALAERRAATVKRDLERAELDRLRKAEAERQQAEAARQEAECAAQAERERREREERIAAEAAAEAKRKAEEAAAAEQRRVEQERLDAIVRAERAEADAKAAAEKAQEDRHRAALEAQRRQDEAIEAERRRVAAAQAADAAAAAKRAADQGHRREINRAAASDLVANVTGLTEDMARAVVIAIAKGDVRAISINY